MLLIKAPKFGYKTYVGEVVLFLPEKIEARRDAAAESL